MNVVLVIVGLAALFAFIALTQELHSIAQELQMSRLLFMQLLDFLKGSSSSDPF